MTKYLLWIWVFLAACTSARKEPAILRIAFPLQPQTLEPAKAGDFPSATLICLIYEGLTRCHPDGGVEPALAKHVEISRDQMTYLFHLRHAQWSDGRPITAYDFETAWRKCLFSSSAYLFYPILNGEKCAKQELPLEAFGVHAVDDATLRVQLEHPTPYFYSLTAFPSFLPAPSHSQDPAVCSGPFQIQKMVLNSEILLVKNNCFWNRKQIFLDTLHIAIVPDETTALHLFEQGELDWVGGPLSPLPPDALDQMDQIRFVPNAASTFICFNTQTGPFQDIHLRKAFAYAIDREQILPSGQLLATRLLPDSLLSGPPLSLPFDPEAARRHLQLAAPLPATLTLYYKPNQTDRRLAQTLQKQWKEVLGVTVQLEQLDLKSLAQRLQSRDYHLCLASWIAQFDDPICILERFKDRANLKNYPGWEDPVFAQLLQEAATSPHRLALLQQAESLMADQLPLLPLYHWRSPALCSSRLTSVSTTPCGGILFERFRFLKNICLQKKGI